MNKLAKAKTSAVTGWSINVGNGQWAYGPGNFFKTNFAQIVIYIFSVILMYIACVCIMYVNLKFHGKKNILKIPFEFSFS